MTYSYIMNKETIKYFIINCPMCNKEHEFTSKDKGKWVKCSDCGEVITVPVTGMFEYANSKKVKQG